MQDHFDDRGLIVGFFKAKTGGKLLILDIIESEAKTALGRPAGVYFEQLNGGVTDLLGRLALCLDPMVITEPVQRCKIGIGTGITADQMQAGDWHIELGGLGIFQGQELLNLAVHFQRFKSSIAADTVIQMHHWGTRM